MLDEARADVGMATGGIVFVSGELARAPKEIAALVGERWRVPAVVVPSAGCISERGEIEQGGAATGMLWSGGRTETFTAGSGGGSTVAHEAIEEAVARASAGRSRARRSTVLLFARPDAMGPADLASIRLAAPGACVLGAGTAGPSPAVVSDGEVSDAPVAGLCWVGGAIPIVDAAPACRLLGEFAPIDEATARGMVLSVGGRPALDALRAAASEAVAGDTQPLVLAALASEDDAGDGQTRFALRALRGVDVDNKGVLVGPDARQGRRLAFAVRDAKASRALLGDAVRRLAEGASGSAPEFALLLSCAGRGQGLYAAPDVDVKIVRQRFGDVPIAGMHSSFEIAPAPRGGAEMMLYTAVVALFRSPS